MFVIVFFYIYYGVTNLNQLDLDTVLEYRIMKRDIPTSLSDIINAKTEACRKILLISFQNLKISSKFSTIIGQ